ncbi:hypothetical protein JCM10207_006720 [Rhodosporidiobolus poonsookiae]
MSSFWLGRRRTALNPQAPAAVAPPPNYEHIEEARLRARRAALRASKLAAVEKFSSQERMARWMERTDEAIGGLEMWRQNVAAELGREKGEAEEQTVAAAGPHDRDETDEQQDAAALLALPADHPRLGRSLPATPSGSDSQEASTSACTAVIATAEVKSVPQGDTPSQDLATFRFPSLPGEPTTSTRETPKRPPLVSTFSSISTMASVEPKPWNGQAPPRSSSLPFNDLVQVTAKPTATPPECSILPPKAAALLGLIPSASAPLGLSRPSGATAPFPLSHPHQYGQVPSGALSSIAPSYLAQADSRADTASLSLSASSRTAGSFWSRRFFGREGSISTTFAGRPSLDSSVPTTASGVSIAGGPRTHRHGVGSSFSAALVSAQANGSTTRRKAPPSQLRTLYLRRDGTTSSPNLTTPVSDTARHGTSAGSVDLTGPRAPFVSYALGARPSYTHDDDDEVESLVDVIDYDRRPPGGGLRGTTVTAASLGPVRQRSASTTGVVTLLARTLSQSRSTGFLARNLSRRDLAQRDGGGERERHVSGAGEGAAKTLVRKLSFRRREAAPLRYSAAAPLPLPLPTPTVDRKMRRRTRDEWQMDSAALAKRMGAERYR